MRPHQRDSFTTNVSKSVAKMQREGLQLNRKPGLAAALRTSLGQQTTSVDCSVSLFEKGCGVQDESSRHQSPIDLGPVFRKSHLNARSSSLSGINNDLKNQSAVSGVSRKKESIDNFKNKLNRLEKNKQDLENKMKLFDAKVNAHSVTKTINDDVDTD